MIIETPRLRLRPIEERDKLPIVHMLNDWEVAQWLSLPPYPYKEKDADHFIEVVANNHTKEKPSIFGIARRNDDNIIGSIGLDIVNNSQSGVGYWIGRDHWKKGYGREALSAAIHYAISGLSSTSMVAVVDPDNISSRKLLQSFNFFNDGMQKLDKPTRRGCLTLDVFRKSLQPYS